MKKILLSFLLLLVLCGCSITRIDNYNYEQLMDYILNFKIKTYNQIGKGYKYYAPKGVIKVDSNNYNDILKKDDRYYYLYVDIVSYYYGTELSYDLKENTLFSKKLKNNNKEGYIEIIESSEKDKLYVKMFYNYAKIETYTSKRELKDTISDISYILSSVDFNDSLLKKMYESGNLDSKEEVFKLFENKEKEGNFLEYIKEYDKYENETDEPENEIKLDNNEQTTTNVVEETVSETTATS